MVNNTAGAQSPDAAATIPIDAPTVGDLLFGHTTPEVAMSRACLPVIMQ